MVEFRQVLGAVVDDTRFTISLFDGLDADAGVTSRFQSAALASGYKRKKENKIVNSEMRNKMSITRRKQVLDDV